MEDPQYHIHALQQAADSHVPSPS